MKKINALGFENFVEDIIITDGLGGEQFRKPNDISFRIMQNRWRIPFEQMVYVGDNPSKDFIAPKKLGVMSVWIDNEDGLHRYNESSGLEGCHRISSVSEVYRVLTV